MRRQIQVRLLVCMVLKAKANDRRTYTPCHDEFRGPRSDYVRQGALATTHTTSFGMGQLNLDSGPRPQ
ncbi:hypothetical protein TNCV_3115331 [Trichonephila clavipes]|nr:hypothetical protein TNCV_3115331 [Trichonephila clavipes]